MIVVDDLALFPAKGLFWVFREIANAVDRAGQDEADAITAQLQELYRQLEEGVIDEDTFDDLEAELLDRLDALEGADDDALDHAA